MITREELEKMIENGETVWTTKPSYRDCGIKLDNEHFVVSYGYLVFTYKAYEILLEDLYKTKEDAQWVIDNWDTRVEEFCPPTWEEFQEVKEYVFVPKSGWRTSININSEDVYNKRISCGCRFVGKVTKENYQKAVEIAHKLFKGEE